MRRALVSYSSHAGETRPGDFGTAVAEVRSKWGWFVALGAVLLILGLIAFGNVLFATLVSVLYIGIMMTIAGIAHILEAFQVRRWGPFLAWLLSGLAYAAAGLLVFYNPVLAAEAMTLALAIILAIAGVLRLGAAVRARPATGWVWLAISGALTILVGVLIAIGWPVSTLWVLGLFLAIDLTFLGLSTLAFGFTLKPPRHTVAA